VWVDRASLEKEKLQALDLPERLVQLAKPREVDILLDSELVPLKVLQAAAELVAPGISLAFRKSKRKEVKAQRDPKRKGGLLDEDIRPLKIGRTLCPSLLRKDSVDIEMGRDDVKDECHEYAKDEPTDPKEVDRNAKAAKGDKARIPTELWDRYMALGLSEDILKLEWKKSLGPLRKFALICWERAISRSLLFWVREVRKVEGSWFEGNELKVIGDALRRMHACSWWEWTAGSTLFFWNWPQEFRLIARLGIAP
jgi:hypothetical protein